MIGIGARALSQDEARVLAERLRRQQLTRQVFDIKGALPASMFADSPHMTKAELEELDAILNADDTKNGKDGQ